MFTPENNATINSLTHMDITYGCLYFHRIDCQKWKCKIKVYGIFNSNRYCYLTSH